MLNLLIKNKGNHIKVSLVWPLAREFTITQSVHGFIYLKLHIGGN